MGAVTVVDRDRARAESIARREVAMYVEAVARLEPVSPPSAAEMRELPVETMRRFAVFGNPDDVSAQLKELFDAGVDLFELGTPHGENELEAVRVLGEEVLPSVLV
jgi:5,10-methylenetetrahydromethanopterin reductase